jgi:hypothetical protein
VRIIPLEETERPRSDAEVAAAATGSDHAGPVRQPTGFEAIRAAVERKEADALLAIGDRLVFSLMMGEIDAAEMVLEPAGEAAYEACRHAGVAAPTPTPVALAIHAGETALRRRWYLRDEPREMNAAMDGWRGIFKPATNSLPKLDQDALAGWRRCLRNAKPLVAAPLPAGLDPEPRGPMAYLLEARQHAATMTLEDGSAPSNGEELSTWCQTAIGVARPHAAQVRTGRSESRIRAFLGRFGAAKCRSRGTFGARVIVRVSPVSSRRSKPQFPDLSGPVHGTKCARPRRALPLGREALGGPGGLLHVEKVSLEDLVTRN